MREKKPITHKDFLIYIGTIVLFSILTVIGVALFLSRGEAPQEVLPSPSPLPMPVEPPEPVLTTGSFTDLFSSKAWVDESKTTLYHDQVANAFTFPPKFDWQKLEVQPPAEELMEAPGDSGDIRCIGTTNQRCLGQRDLALYYAGPGDGALFEHNSISLPAELQGKDLINLSIGSLSSKWVVGATTKNGNNYRGYVFIFDGVKFTKVTSGEGEAFLDSPYSGVFGFGGIDSDWVFVYGAYRGLAYRVKNNLATENLSELFNIRVMQDGGFKAEVLRTKDSLGRITWYISSLTKSKPALLKLFQNNSKISGIVDYFQSLNLGGGVESLSLQPILGSAHSFLVKLKRASGGEMWKFQDLGFDKSKKYQIYSGDILRGKGIGTENITLKSVAMSEGGGTAIFYLSSDGINWKPVAVPNTIDFKDMEGKGVFWRAAMKPDQNPYSSIFLTRIDLEYNILFLRN